MGIKYTCEEVVIIGWQCDDVFGQITHIVVVVLFRVMPYSSLSIDRHYHSYIIRKNNEATIYSLSELNPYKLTT